VGEVCEVAVEVGRVEVRVIPILTEGRAEVLAGRALLAAKLPALPALCLGLAYASLSFPRVRDVDALGTRDEKVVFDLLPAGFELGVGRSRAETPIAARQCGPCRS